MMINLPLRRLTIILLGSLSTLCFAFNDSGQCCKGLGGVQYCDSSSGFYVCQNGSYSSCYCTPKAIMDLKQIEGCCLWQGGVMETFEPGIIRCNDGSISFVCSGIGPTDKIAAF
jgi:hypothetical protein